MRVAVGPWLIDFIEQVAQHSNGTLVHFPGPSADCWEVLEGAGPNDRDVRGQYFDTLGTIYYNAWHITEGGRLEPPEGSWVLLERLGFIRLDLNSAHLGAFRGHRFVIAAPAEPGQRSDPPESAYCLCALATLTNDLASSAPVKNVLALRPDQRPASPLHYRMVDEPMGDILVSHLKARG